MALTWLDKNPNLSVPHDANRFQRIEETRRNLSRTENSLERVKRLLKKAKENKDFGEILYYEKEVKHWVNRRDFWKAKLEADIKEQDIRRR